eukprot:scaffold764_cov240-Chaetoceros_neogracile.AAC.14
MKNSLRNLPRYGSLLKDHGLKRISSKNQNEAFSSGEQLNCCIFYDTGSCRSVKTNIRIR